MRIRHSGAGKEEQPQQLQMSSMIDVVFLLLIFFVMTFQITAAEGDVEINTATSADSAVDREPPRKQVFHVRLLADSTGGLAGIQFDGRRLSTIEQLRDVVREIAEAHSDDQLAVQLRSDKQLLYQNTMDAVTAIRGGDPDRPLIRDIRFVQAD